MGDSKNENPDLTTVGGQPHGKRRRGFRGQIKVPVGLEKALFHAAGDDEFKRRLLSDPRVAIEEAGIRLRPSELAMIAAVSSAALEEMIDRVVPSNPKNRKFMGLVASAAASLAAGTVLIGCGDDHLTTRGAGPDTGPYDGGDPGDTDSGNDTDTGTDTGTSTGTPTGTGTATATGTDTDTVETDVTSTPGSDGVGPDVGGY